MTAYARKFTAPNVIGGAHFGQFGHEWLDGSMTEPSEGLFTSIVASEDSDIDYTDEKTNVTHTGIVIPRGFTIYGKLSNVTVNSGKVIAYYGDFKNVI